MFGFGTQTRFRATVIVAIVAALGATLSTPASATDGRTAVGMCIDNTARGLRCAWAPTKDGGVVICNPLACISCPSATGECTVIKGLVKRPTRALPVGTIVITKMGKFTVR